MKLASFTRNGQASYGIVLEDGGIVDLGARLGPGIPDLKSLLAEGLDVLEGMDVSADTTAENVTWLPTIPNPSVIWCAGINTHSHFDEVRERLHLDEKPAKPMFFLRAPGTIVGSETPIEKPALEQIFDYEGEIAIVIGKTCRNVSVEDALSYVAGYTCFNDGSARIYQISSNQMTTGKNAWRSGSMGPWLVTSDSIELDEMELTTYVNGEQRQEMKLDDLIFGFRQLISHISEVYQLEPGDVIATGSAEGAGALREPMAPLVDGDLVEVAVNQIGCLSNPVLEQRLA